MRVLVVEDDTLLCQHLKRKLTEESFVADVVQDGDEADLMMETGVYDLVVLDLGLPGKGGMQLLKGWRKAKNATPVIILSARSSWQEKIEGIEAGADDYVGKPFQTPELVARIKALLRRSKVGNPASLSHLGCRLDEGQQSVVTAQGNIIQLTGTEFRLLRCFMLNPRRILSKEMLMSRLYDQDCDYDETLIEVYINHLRKKLGKDFIQTLRGQGYRLVQGESP